MSEVPDMKQAFLASRIFDGTTRDYLTNTALLIEGLQIVALVPQSQVPSEHQAVDLGSLSILPGLIDCHVHLVWNGSHNPNPLPHRESNEKTAVRTRHPASQHTSQGTTT